VLDEGENNEVILVSLSATSAGGGGAGYRPNEGESSGSGSGGSLYNNNGLYSTPPFVFAGNNGNELLGGAGGTTNLNLAINFMGYHLP